jgi:GNAT superfamily N-acetyltransferase
MALTVRRATPADAPVVAEFNSRLARETEGKALDPAALAAGVAAVLADPNKGIYFVAEDDGAVLGMTEVTFEWSDWRNGWLWWIQSVYVRVDARRRGVFRRLYEHIYQTAVRESDVVGLRLYVEHNNRVAQQTYLRLGMKEAGYRILEKYPL